MTLTTRETDSAVSAPWWNSSFRMFQTNLREIDAGLDVERTLDFIEAHGADTWLINAGGILSFYPTDLPFQIRNPRLEQRASGDLLGDAVEAAHARGIRLMARMDFSKVERSLALANPEWAWVGPDGLWQEYQGLVSVSLTGDYYQHRSLDIIDEVIDRYAVDGFFFNWFGFSEVDYNGEYRGVCHAESSRRAFERETGLTELPEGPRSPGYPVWRRFAERESAALTARIHEHIAARRPDAGLILGEAADIRFHEANNAVGRDLWHHATSESVSALRAARPEVPVLVNSVAFLDMPYRFASEQPELFSHYLVQTISRGGNPSTYVMGPPGAVPYASVEAAGVVTRFHRDHRDLYDTLTASAVTALVRPTAGDRIGQRHGEAIDEFRGWYSALQESHVPFDVVPIEAIAAQTTVLERFRVLVLPDVGEIDEATVAVLEGWVAAGGRLVSTGSSALDRAGTVQLACLPAATVREELSGRAQLRSTYVASSADIAAAETIVPIYGRRFVFDYRDSAHGMLAVLGQAPFGPPEKAYGNPLTDQPGYSVAQGTTQVAWTIGRAYRDLGLTAIRDLAVTIVRDALDGAEPVRATLAEQAEITVGRSGESTAVHIINYSGARRKTIGGHVRLPGGELRVAHARGRATALVSGMECATRVDGDDLVVDVPDIDQFEVIVVADS